MKFVDLFSGIGGFRVALESLGHECVFSNDIDPYTSAIYRKHWNDGTHLEGDIRSVRTADVPDFDILCSGNPCQDFSVAGKRQGIEGTRGSLFYEVARFLSEKRPRYFLLENVRGLLSNDEGQDFQAVLGVLADIGYTDFQWSVLNSKNFGVPQNRERVFVVGNLRGERRPEVFPFGEDDCISHPNGREMLPCLTATDWKGPSKQRAGIIVAMTAYTKGNRTASRIQESETYPCLDSSVGYAVSNGLTPFRRLTPTECERLQGFPDGWTKEGLFSGGIKAISDTRRYMALGNSVTTNVVKKVGEKLSR